MTLDVLSKYKEWPDHKQLEKDMNQAFCNHETPPFYIYHKSKRGESGPRFVGIRKRRHILLTVIGLLVVILAFAVVRFFLVHANGK